MGANEEVIHGPGDGGLNRGRSRGTEQNEYIVELLEARRLYKTLLRVVCGQGRQESRAG